MTPRFNPLDYPICLTSPTRIAPTTWITHTPFAMFLVDILRPSIIVELGTQYGVSYCAFCQAVKTLNIEARCYAVDTWQGDFHTGKYGHEILNNLKKYHDPLYDTFSRLIQSTFDDALKNFEDGTIDLLHIDGLHTYDAVKNDFTNWLPKLSERGVMLFHDICEKQDDFGVWKLWDELKVKYPFFDFFYGHGLGVLVVGKNYPPALDMLLTALDEQAAIKEFFLQLGLMAERDIKLGEKTQELERVLNSKGWRFIRILRKFRLRLLPINSRRERLLKFVFKGIKHTFGRA